MSDDKWLGKVMDLLAHAERTDNEAEAETFFAKAAELMERHAIDEARLMAARKIAKAGGEVEKPISTDGVIKGTYCTGYKHVMYAVAKNSHVKFIGSNIKESCREYYHMVGFKSDIERVNILYASLMIQAERAMRAESAKVPYFSSLARNKQFQWKRSFLIGFANGVSAKMHEANKLAIASIEEELAASGESTSVALALRDRDAAVNDAVGEIFGKLRKTTSRMVQLGGASGAGYRAGQSADIAGSTLGRGVKGALGQ